MPELSTWSGWQPWFYQNYPAGTEVTAEDLRTTLGANAHVIGVYMEDAGDEVELTANSVRLFFKAAATDTTFFDRPIPTLINDGTSQRALTLRFDDGASGVPGGACRIFYIFKGT